MSDDLKDAAYAAQGLALIAESEARHKDACDYHRKARTIQDERILALEAALAEKEAEVARLRDALTEITQVEIYGVHSVSGEWFVPRSLMKKAHAALNAPDERTDP